MRDYVRGDELRHISWTATARRGKLTTRQYQIERDQTILIALDATNSGIVPTNPTNADAISGENIAPVPCAKLVQASKFGRSASCSAPALALFTCSPIILPPPLPQIRA